MPDKPIHTDGEKRRIAGVGTERATTNGNTITSSPLVMGNVGPEGRWHSRIEGGKPVKIHRLLWPEDRIEHIADHGVARHEVEEVCFGRPFVLRGKSEGANPVYYVLGETATKRLLFCVVIQFPDGNGYPVTARPMTKKEKRRYKQWRSL